MAASPSPAEITAGMRKGLHALANRLAEKGIHSRYTRATYPRLLIDGANVEYAEYRLLRASNGECAGYPRIVYREEGRAVGLAPGEQPRLVYEGWDAFDKIERRSE